MRERALLRKEEQEASFVSTGCLSRAGCSIRAQKEFPSPRLKKLQGEQRWTEGACHSVAANMFVFIICTTKGLTPLFLLVL